MRFALAASSFALVGCSIFGSVEGDYQLAVGGAGATGGGGGGGVAGMGGGGNDCVLEPVGGAAPSAPWTVMISASHASFFDTEASVHALDVDRRGQVLFAGGGWGAVLRVEPDLASAAPSDSQTLVQMLGRVSALGNDPSLQVFGESGGGGQAIRGLAAVVVEGVDWVITSGQCCGQIYDATGPDGCADGLLGCVARFTEDLAYDRSAFLGDVTASPRNLVELESSDSLFLAADLSVLGTREFCGQTVGAVGDVQRGFAVVELGPDLTCERATRFQAADVSTDVSALAANASGTSFIVSGAQQEVDPTGWGLPPTQGLLDAFTLDLDESFEAQAVHPLGGASNDVAAGVAMHRCNGLVVTVGSLSDGVDFGGEVIANGTTVASIHASGAYEWELALGTTQGTTALATAVAINDERIAVVGDVFHPSGQTSFAGDTVTVLGNKNGFVATMNHDGSDLRWDTFAGDGIAIHAVRWDGPSLLVGGSFQREIVPPGQTAVPCQNASPSRCAFVSRIEEPEP